MAKKEEWRTSAGINDDYGFCVMNIAADPDRNRTEAEKGPRIVKESVSSDKLKDGVLIKAYDSNEKGR